MDTNKHIIRFNDLVFKKHPNASAIFTNQAIVVLPNGHRISVVGPRTSYLLYGLEGVGTYEMLGTDWEEPIVFLTEDEVDLILVKCQKGPLDLIPEIEKHRFIK